MYCSDAVAVQLDAYLLTRVVTFGMRSDQCGHTAGSMPVGEGRDMKSLNKATRTSLDFKPRLGALRLVPRNWAKLPTALTIEQHKQHGYLFY